MELLSEGRTEELRREARAREPRSKSTDWRRIMYPRAQRGTKFGQRMVGTGAT